jgi:hypothetical protein
VTTVSKLLLSAHVLAAIVFIGPVTVAVSLFPRYAAQALAEASRRLVGASPAAVSDGEAPVGAVDDHRSSTEPVTRLLHRISRVYSVLGLAVPVLGLALAIRMRVLGDVWLLASIVLMVMAAVCSRRSYCRPSTGPWPCSTASRVTDRLRRSNTQPLGTGPEPRTPVSVECSTTREGVATMTTSPTDGVRTARPSRREALTSRRFVLHYLQMLAAMLAGMALLMPVSMLVGAGAGVELQTLLMATSMSVGMAALMVWHRSPVPSIVEMCLAMYLSFAVLLPAHWLGVLPGEAVIGLGHVVMLPMMAAVMLRRREQYLDHR